MNRPTPHDGPPDRRSAPRRPWLRLLGGAGAAAALAAPVVLSPIAAQADRIPLPLPQSAMQVVDADSVEPGSTAANVLDGDPATIWHTAWSKGKAPLPHHLSVRIAAEPRP